MKIHHALCIASLLTASTACGPQDPVGASRHALRCAPVPGVDNDGDCIANAFDNCPSAFNWDQADHDGDLVGDICDAHPGDPADLDGDDLDTDASSISNVPDPAYPDDPQGAAVLSPVDLIDFSSGGPIRTPAKAYFSVSGLPANSDLTLTLIHRGESDGNFCTVPSYYSTATEAARGGCFDLLLSNLPSFTPDFVWAAIPNGPVSGGVMLLRRRTISSSMGGTGAPGYTKIDGTNVWTHTRVNVWTPGAVPATGYPIPTAVVPAVGSLAALPPSVTISATQLTPNVAVYFNTVQAVVQVVDLVNNTITVQPPVQPGTGIVNITVINQGVPQRANVLPQSFTYIP